MKSKIFLIVIVAASLFGSIFAKSTERKLIDNIWIGSWNEFTIHLESGENIWFQKPQLDDENLKRLYAAALLFYSNQEPVSVEYDDEVQDGKLIGRVISVSR